MSADARTALMAVAFLLLLAGLCALAEHITNRRDRADVVGQTEPCDRCGQPVDLAVAHEPHDIDCQGACCCPCERRPVHAECCPDSECTEAAA